MKTLNTDTSNITLTLGDHLQAPHLPQDRVHHVSMLPIELASTALVDVDNRRVVWLSTNNQLCFDPHVCCGKVRAAIKAYQRRYGIKTHGGSSAPGEDRSGAQMVALQVSAGVVTSHIWTTQKHSYYWDWATHKHVTTNRGRKYNGVSRPRLRPTSDHPERKA